MDKQDGPWEQAHLRTPEAFQHWADILAWVRNQLFLSRDLAASRRPWEHKARSATPSQARRSLEAIIGQLGTSARASQARGNSPCRLKGAIIAKAERFKVVFKDKKKAQKHKESV